MRRPNLAPGAPFGRYVVLARLGRGGVGEVWKVRDTKLDREVALKIVQLGSATDRAPLETIDPTNEGDVPRGHALEAALASPPELDDLMREARAAAAIEHPNVISIFEIAELEGTAFLTMELIVGRTLRAWAGDASIADRLRALSTVARALAAAHVRGVVHRDVKPDNVMMRDDGVLKVLDFGIARRVRGSLDPNGPSGDLARRTLTNTGEWGVAGTPAYMAPEQLRGERLDGRCDQFAWGVMAYELLVGASPWPGRDAIAVVSQILEASAAPLVPDVADLPPGVDVIVARALSKDRADRFPSMTDVGDAIDEALTARLPPERERLVTKGRIAFALAAATALGSAFIGNPHAAPIAKHAGHATIAKRIGPAAAAFEEAKRDFREASIVEARRELARATEIDPTFAAAHLWQGLLSEDLDDEMHASLAQAVKYRSTLTANETVILQSVEPWLSAPADWIESERRLAEAQWRFPLDAELAFLVGRTRYHRGEYDGALTAFEEAKRRDAGLAAADFNRGLVFIHRGSADEADDAFRACLDRAPGSTSCLRELALDDEAAGRCREEAEIARKLSSLEPDTREWRALAGQALLSDDVHSEEGRRAIEASWERAAPRDRARMELADRTSLDLLEGDFVAAASDAAAWEAAVDRLPNAMTHLAPVRTRMQIALETGDRATASSLADRYIRRQSAWITDDDGWGSEIDAIGVQYRSGAIARPAFLTARNAWLDRETLRASRFGARQRGLLWIVGVAANVISRDDAREALSILPSFEPLPSAIDVGLAGARPVGETYRLAAKYPEALEWLHRAAASCQPMEYPVLWVEAQASLGFALEAVSDFASACVWYERVLRLWGRAESSMTANDVRARSRTLRCASSSPSALIGGPLP